MDEFLEISYTLMLFSFFLSLPSYETNKLGTFGWLQNQLRETVSTSNKENDH